MYNAFWRHALFVRGQSFFVKPFDRSLSGCQVIGLGAGTIFVGLPGRRSLSPRVSPPRARVFSCSHEFFVERLCSGLWSGSFSVLPPPPIPYFSSFHCFISVTGAWNGGSWLGCGDLPAMGAVFYQGAGWPQWKPLGIPDTHLPLKQGGCLIE